MNNSLSQAIVPHARTLRKAREQVKVMVNTGFSTLRIRTYLKKWSLWWAITTEFWNQDYLLNQLIKSCWDEGLATFVADLLPRITLLDTCSRRCVVRII